MTLHFTIPAGKHDRGARVFLGTKPVAYRSSIPVLIRGAVVGSAPALIFTHVRADVGSHGPIRWQSLN